MGAAAFAVSRLGRRAARIAAPDAALTTARSSLAVHDSSVSDGIGCERSMRYRGRCVRCVGETVSACVQSVSGAVTKQIS